jgi:hypothetical protein
LQQREDGCIHVHAGSPGIILDIFLKISYSTRREPVAQCPRKGEDTQTSILPGTVCAARSRASGWGWVGFACNMGIVNAFGFVDSVISDAAW